MLNRTTFTIPCVPPSGNHQTGYNSRTRKHFTRPEVLRFRELVAMCARGRQVIAKRYRVNTRIYLGKGQRRDDDNMRKTLHDALAKAGVVVGGKRKDGTYAESDAGIREGSFWVGRDRDNPRTEVEVEAV